MTPTAPRNVLVGYFDVPGFGTQTAETELVGKPADQYLRLQKAMEAKYPGTQGIRRTGSVIETRTPENAYIDVTPGQTLAQLFGNGQPESLREIGRVFFDGSPQKILLTLSRSQGHVSINLKPIMRGDGPISFSNRISPQRPVTELPQIVRNTLGNSARDITLKLRMVDPKTRLPKAPAKPRTPKMPEPTMKKA